MIWLFKPSESSIETEYYSIIRQLGRLLDKRKTSRRLTKVNSYQMELLYFVTSRAYNNTDFFTQQRVEESVSLSERTAEYLTDSKYGLIAKARTEGIEEAIEDARGLKELFRIIRA